MRKSGSRTKHCPLVTWTGCGHVPFGSLSNLLVVQVIFSIVGLCPHLYLLNCCR